MNIFNALSNKRPTRISGAGNAGLSSIPIVTFKLTYHENEISFDGHIVDSYFHG